MILKKITIQTSKSNITRAGSYIDTPTELKLKRAVVNILNKGNKCIKWSLLAFLHYDNIKNYDKN